MIKYKIGDRVIILLKGGSEGTISEFNDVQGVIGIKLDYSYGKIYWFTSEQIKKIKKKK